MARLLFLEDEQHDADRVTEILGNHDIIHYLSSEVIVHEVQAQNLLQNFDLAIIDLYVRGENVGIYVINTIRAIDQNIPIIVLTSDDTFEREMEAYQQRANQYIRKSDANLRVRLQTIVRTLTRPANSIAEGIDVIQNNNGDMIYIQERDIIMLNNVPLPLQEKRKRILQMFLMEPRCISINEVVEFSGVKFASGKKAETAYRNKMSELEIEEERQLTKQEDCIQRNCSELPLIREEVSKVQRRLEMHCSMTAEDFACDNKYGTLRTHVSEINRVLEEAGANVRLNKCRFNQQEQDSTACRRSGYYLAREP